MAEGLPPCAGWVSEGPGRSCVPWLPVARDSNLLGCYPLIPWANRVGGRGFHFRGQFHPLAPNRAGEAYPIHGNAWQRPWAVVARGPQHVVLELETRLGSFAYAARIRYELDGGRLQLHLEVENRGQTTLPFGLGLHPWFPRTARTHLRATAAEVLRTGADLLPQAWEPLNAAVDFCRSHALPRDLVDNCFSGWDGQAEIVWPERGLALRMSCVPGPNYFQLYTPPKRAVFCLEPVTHPVNALNLPEDAPRRGLRDLGPGEVFALETVFSMAALAG